MEDNKEALGKRGHIPKKEIIAVAALALLTVVLIIFLIFFGGLRKDGETEPRSRMFYEYFDTLCYVYDYSAGTDGEFEESCRLIEEQIAYYHRLFDIYNEYEGMTNLATVNRLAGAGEVEVDHELAEFLLYAISMHELTEGNVNIAMGSVLSIWHRYREVGSSIPAVEELLAAGEHTDIEDLIVDEARSTVRFADGELKLDVGAIAKGYAAEMCAQLLEEAGVSSYVLDFGGNLRVVGTKPDGGSWRTGIKNPDLSSDTPYVHYLDVADTSVVTSGDYQRSYVVDGVKYHHIINKDTLFPASFYSSVTVVTEHSGFADALSTALFNMKKDEATALLDTFDGVSVIWVYPDGKLEFYGFD